MSIVFWPLFDLPYLGFLKTIDVSGGHRAGRLLLEGGPTAAMARSRDTAEFSRVEKAHFVFTTLSQIVRKNMFHVYKSISRERIFAFPAIGKRL